MDGRRGSQMLPVARSRQSEHRHRPVSVPLITHPAADRAALRPASPYVITVSGSVVHISVVAFGRWDCDQLFAVDRSSGLPQPGTEGGPAGTGGLLSRSRLGVPGPGAS